MDAFDGDEEKTAAVVEFLYSQTAKPDVNAKLADDGAVIYEREGCPQCHSLDGVGTGTAPDLKGWASEEWLSAFIRQPGHDRFYGKLNEMDDFDADKVSKVELQRVISWLRSQSDEKAGF